jgi:hypothetical protein
MLQENQGRREEERCPRIKKNSRKKERQNVFSSTAGNVLKIGHSKVGQWIANNRTIIITITITAKIWRKCLVAWTKL